MLLKPVISHAIVAGDQIAPRAALILFCVANLVAPAFAGSPYQSISDRNVFHLKAATITRSETAPAPLPKIHLTGITTILKGKRALLKVEFPAKPPQPAREESYILTEGQRTGSIEVLEINEKKDQVKVDYSGTITNLTFEKIAPAHTPTPVPSVSGQQSLRYRQAFR